MIFSWEGDRQTDSQTDTQTDKVTTREACASKNGILNLLAGKVVDQ